MTLDEYLFVEEAAEEFIVDGIRELVIPPPIVDYLPPYPLLLACGGTIPGVARRCY